MLDQNPMNLERDQENRKTKGKEIMPSNLSDKVYNRKAVVMTNGRLPIKKNKTNGLRQLTLTGLG